MDISIAMKDAEAEWLRNHDHAERELALEEMAVQANHRSIGELSDDEWDELMAAFADEILPRFRVVGSIAGVYSLYEVMDREREHAMKAEGREP